MTAEVYKILIIVTLLMQSLCIIAGLRLVDKVENRSMLIFILLGVGIIFLIQLIDLFSFDYPDGAILDMPIYFEIISLISSIVLLWIILLFNAQTRVIPTNDKSKPRIEREDYSKTKFAREPVVQPITKPAAIPIEKAQFERKEPDKKESKDVDTAQKNLREFAAQLEKVTAQKDKLVSLISHDLRTPLNSVFGFCQLLKEGEYKGKKEVKKFAENIYDLSKIQLNALNKILDWTRYESKDIQINPTQFDVTSTINFVAKSFANAAQKKNITIKVSSERNLIVFGDEFMIIEVLKNLLENAIKYSSEESTVEIITHYHPKLNKLVLLVCDSGIGIKKDVLMNLLSTSSKTSTRGTKGEKGIGLGLLICKAIIDKHGEHLWIASEEGKWTRVYFTLKPSV